MATSTSTAPAVTEPPTSAFARLATELACPCNVGGWPDRFGASLRHATSNASGTSARKPRVLALFAGAGGLDLGFEDAGFDVVGQVEIEKRFVATLQKNAPSHAQAAGASRRQIFHADIRAFVAADNAIADIDFIIGGPPCQSFSAAGRRASGVRGLSDPRGTLFEEYVRLLAELQPRGFLFENVAGITGANGGRAWRQIVDAFAAQGYSVYARVVDAADFGVPQHRERLIIVGARDRGFRFPTPTHGPDSPDKRPLYTAGLALTGLDIARSVPGPVTGKYGGLLELIPPGLNYSFFTEKLGHPRPLFAWRSKFSDFLYKADPQRPVRTIKAQGGQYTGPFHWNARPFTLAELQRLQTFPDRYEVVGGRQVAVQQLGNSVPPQLARVLALAVRSQLFDLSLPGDVTLPTVTAAAPLGFRTRKRTRTAYYRELAAAAHSELPTQRPRPSSDPAWQVPRYTAVLTATHAFDARKDQSGAVGERFAVRAAVDGDVWRFDVRAQRSPKAMGEGQLRVVPTGRWNLPMASVELNFAPLSSDAFTATWKAFEAALRDTGAKIDLVALSGYYQYAPRIAAQLTAQTGRAHTAKDQLFWECLADVVAGVGTRETNSHRFFGQLWGLGDRAVLAFCQQLKAAGYEVRNHHTNPEIRDGSVLVPYAFPTLQPASVQRKKSLFAAV